MSPKRTFNRAAVVAVAAVLVTATVSTAAPTVDGTRDAAYGSPLAAQVAPTQFGDNNVGDIGNASGSEIDAAYGTVANGNLYLFFAGNLESNFNHIEIFIDSQAGGQNTLRGDNAGIDFGGLNRLGATDTQRGLTFDTNFVSDYYVGLAGGGSSSSVFANFATLPTGTGGTGFFLGSAAYGSNGTLTGGDAGAPAILATINNSNTAGVTGAAADPLAAAAVATGIELAIPLSAIGNPTTDINVAAIINGSGHDFLSNQSAGPLPAGAGNPGDPRLVDFSTIAGNQFVTVPNAVPEPGTIALLALGATALLRQRRRACRP